MDFDKQTDLKKFREKILAAIDPIIPANDTTKAKKDFLFTAVRTEAGRSLPSYFEVYFLLVELLNFKNIGQFEKVAWSVPIDYMGEAFLIEHRKFGIGVFANPNKEKEAAEITALINKAVKLATPYFEYLALKASENSKLNVRNNSRDLFERYNHFLKLYKAKITAAKKAKKKVIVKKFKSSTSYSFPSVALQKEAGWLAISVIDSFFSWTEHIFIHMAILNGKIKTGKEVAELAAKDWSFKFKSAVSINTPELKIIYDELIIIRRQIRNYIAHGSFGKQGEAFSFHSGAGAVPLLLPHQEKAKFRFNHALEFNDTDAIKIIETFVKIVWKDERAPAKLYVQDAELPLILTYTDNGEYVKAMKSMSSMKKLVDHLLYIIDRSANMDF